MAKRPELPQLHVNILIGKERWHDSKRSRGFLLDNESCIPRMQIHLIIIPNAQFREEKDWNYIHGKTARDVREGIDKITQSDC